MNKLDQWLSKQALLEEKTPSLIDAILRNDLRSYVAYRLKFLSVRVLVEILTTFVEFIFFFYLLKRSDVQIILVAKILTVVAEAWIWGVLELPRTKIRNLMNDGRRVKVRLEIRDWLLFSGVISAVLLVISFAYLAYASMGSSTLTYVEFYIFASILKIALDVFVKTFHSCVYAVTRIFRPLFIVILLQLILFSGSLLTWNYLGFWALPITQFLVSVVLSALTIYYTKRQYDRLKLPVEKLLTPPKLPKLSVKEHGFALLTGTTNTLMKFETLLVLVILRSGQNNTGLINLALFFFLISPMLKGSFDWARLFYFDYKRIEVGSFSNLRARFNRYLNGTSVAVAVVCWFLATMTGIFVFKLNQVSFIFVMLLVFVFRSLLGSYQVRAFSNSMYLKLLVSEFVFISGLGALLFFNSSLSIMMIIAFTVAAEAISLIPLFIMELKPIRIWQERQVYSYAEWLSVVSNYHHRCRVALVEFNVEDDNNQIQQNAASLKRDLGPNGVVTCLDNKTILFLERPRVNAIEKKNILIMFSGTTRRIWLIDQYKENGKSALAELHLALSSKAFTPEVLLDDFRKLFPRNSYCVDLNDVNNEITQKFAFYERQTIIREAVRYSKGMTKGSYKFRYLVSAFYPKGELKYIFLIPRSKEDHRIQKWLALLNVANYQNSLNE